MFKNQLKIALRSILRYRTYAAINIVGLTLGLCSVLLIVVYIGHELSYDKFHDGADRIYRVSESVPLGDNQKVIASTSAALASRLRNDFTELEHVTFFTRPQYTDVTFEDKRYYEDRIHLVDDEFFEVFNFRFLNGTAEALSTVNSIIISESIAEKYFGNQQAIGQIINLNQFYGGSDLKLEVAAIFEDLPVNSHFHMDFIVGVATARPYIPRGMVRSWGWDSGYTYIKTPPGYDIEAFDQSMPAFIKKHVGENTNWLTYFTRNLTEIHLDSQLNSELEANGNRQNVQIFSIIALAILFIASVNYVNMATAIATRRAKEVGIMKTLGASRSQLVRQYVLEALAVTSLAILLGGFLAEVLTPYFNELAGKSIEVGFMDHPVRIALYVGCSLVLGLLSSIYPALYLSSFSSLQQLKGGKVGKSLVFSFRKGMLVVQFGISIFLIIGSIMVYTQWNFMRNKNYGLNVDTTMTFSLQGSENRQRFDLLRAALEQNPAISKITSSNRQVGRDINNQRVFNFYEPDSTLERITLSVIWMEPSFLEDMGVALKEGRYFHRDRDEDVNQSIILNEAALGLFENNEVLGRAFRIDDITGHVVGITQDFHFESLYNTIKPIVFVPISEAQNYVTISVASTQFSETLRFVEQAWNDFDPHKSFRYHIISDDLRNLYVGEERFLNVFTVATGLAIFIACLGVFGLVSFSAYQRIKEIGIRKVLGAGTIQITTLLTKEFLYMILIGTLMAWPVAYYFTGNWLDNYSYRIGFVWWPYLTAGAIALLIAVATASSQTIKAARKNPVDSLKYE